MHDEQWRRIADRIESTWPGEPGEGDRYREELADLDPQAVDAALDSLLIDHRNAAPSPRVVRERVAELPPEEMPGETSGWGEDPSSSEWSSEETPPEAAAPTAPAPGRSRPVEDAPTESRRATVALILGAAGFVTVPLVVSVIAIVVANGALAEIEADPSLGGAQRARIGRLLGWIGITIAVLTVVIGVIVGLTD